MRRRITACPARPIPRHQPRRPDTRKINVLPPEKPKAYVPWKELAIPQDMVVDGWGRYIIYKPAPGLTVDTQSAAMKDTAGTVALDVHNACRSALWYDADGNHLNRAKALFCCNAPPPNDNSVGTGPVVDAASAECDRTGSGRQPGFSERSRL